MTELIFYGATQRYSQTTFLKNWILCLFVLWVICWNRFQNRFKLLRFFSEVQKKDSQTQIFRPRKDPGVHRTQTFSLYVSWSWGQLRRCGLLRLSWLPPFFKTTDFPSKKEFHTYNFKEHFLWNKLFLPVNWGYQSPDLSLWKLLHIHILYIPMSPYTVPLCHAAL